ncbi:MAG: ScpA family protein [Patescibacteria group bacterium]|jgi:segregation and condensation protein A
MRTVQLSQFHGPLDLLLTLIEREKLDISEIALAQVTEQYLGFLTAAEEMDVEDLADFLVVAARLLVIKSRALLPMLTEEDEDAVDLERQLKIYKEYYDAAQVMAGMLHKHRFTYGRETAVRIEAQFSPPPKLKVDGLHASLLHVLKQLEPIVLYRDEATIKRTVSLREKIAHIHSLLMQSESLDFHNLLERAESRTDVIITFLAILELVKQQHVVVQQQNMFDSFRIDKHNAEPL